MSRVSTDGCSELTCPHHGPENSRKLALIEQRKHLHIVRDVCKLDGQGNNDNEEVWTW